MIWSDMVWNLSCICCRSVCTCETTKQTTPRLPGATVTGEDGNPGPRGRLGSGVPAPISLWQLRGLRRGFPLPGFRFPGQITPWGGEAPPRLGPAAIQNLLGLPAVLTAWRLWGVRGAVKGGLRGELRGAGLKWRGPGGHARVRFRDG